jgi:hypothetical protein
MQLLAKFETSKVAPFSTGEPEGPLPSAAIFSRDCRQSTLYSPPEILCLWAVEQHDRDGLPYQVLGADSGGNWASREVPV